MFKEFSRKISGKTYKYLDSGRDRGKPPLVFLHGYCGSKQYFGKVFESLCSRYRVILPDLPGHNDLDFMGLDSISGFADYIRLLIGNLELGTFCVGGYSMGGMVASALAEQEKDSSDVRGIVVWASPVLGYSSGGTKSTQMNYKVVKYLPAFIYNAVFSYRGLKLFSPLLGMPLSDLEAEAFSKVDKYGARRLIEMMNGFAYNVTNSLPKVFLYDRFDRSVLFKNYEFLKGKNRSGEKFVSVDHGGHFGTKEGWAKAVSEIEKFLDEVGK